MRGQTEFNEAWMQPSGAYGHKAPESSRVSRTFRDGVTKIRTRGLERCMVKITLATKTTWEITLADGGRRIGWIRSHRGKGTTYSYQICGEIRVHGGFPSRKSAVDRMLVKI